MENKKVRPASLARIRNGSTIATSTRRFGMSGRVTYADMKSEIANDRAKIIVKVAIYMVALAVLVFVSLGIMGAQGKYYLGSLAYQFYDPIQVANVIYWHAHEAIAEITHAFDVPSQQWLTDNVPGYWAIPKRAAVIGITFVCAILLAVSGMLYQAAFRNPIAGPSILGVSSGSALGVAVLVLIFGSAAPLMVPERYALCYGFGAAILVLVILAAKYVSRKEAETNTLSLLLIGSIVGQLLGFLISYVTLFVMDEDTYAIYFEVSQMLVVDTSTFSWVCLGVAFALTFIPVFFLRFQMNALLMNDDEVRPLGLNLKLLRSIALVCGGIMILAAQVHTGMVGMVTLVVPFMARRWFGCEFGRQLIGSVCIGSILLVACRDIADLIPFVGDGISVGSMVGIISLPLFLLLVFREREGGR